MVIESCCCIGSLLYDFSHFAANDGVTSLSFSPTSNLLVGTSWNNQVLCWDIQQSGQVIPKAAINLEKPALCSAWSTDGSVVFAGGCDNSVKMWNLQTNQQQQVAQHQGPVRHCFFVNQMNMLITGSWDKTIKYWDLRQPNPAHTQQLPERVYAMDVLHPLLVVGTADRTIQVYNLSSPQQPYKQLQSPLKYQTRCISCFPDTSGYLVGSVEGRVAVHHVEDSLQSKNFTFKCHRYLLLDFIYYQMLALFISIPIGGVIVSLHYSCGAGMAMMCLPSTP